MSEPDLARLRDEYARQSAEWSRLKERLAALPSRLRIAVSALDDEREAAAPTTARGPAFPSGLRG